MYYTCGTSRLLFNVFSNELTAVVFSSAGGAKVDYLVLKNRSNVNGDINQSKKHETKF